ncbi:glycosyltransferase, partial [Streptomyces albidoflavus]
MQDDGARVPGRGERTGAAVRLRTGLPGPRRHRAPGRAARRARPAAAVA